MRTESEVVPLVLFLALAALFDLGNNPTAPEALPAVSEAHRAVVMVIGSRSL